ncbi:YifB family Mg chelatase-like AAA ATPase [Tissierella sp. Yu-01]|uniref:YifB family Mg chelatase-like AAA ATPase n=1 Tax=Tissierella sp. Yu-01 TaxID=3035694 RepID=UPI00240E86F4|nr:YifB family Mg chelatase-like AAA ATPase [Tissierella sp. Yu-01]WFA09777.1 YifB family Mg chelatase-like AAA ATPase [Tissierella sp. Yu-01]
MYSKLNTCVLQGLDGHVVEVETDLSRGLPVFNIVGLPDTAIKESKERVRTAIKNSGFNFPLNRITINLAPANLRKDGSQMDLAIAVGILIADSVINQVDTSNTVFIGELALDGKINPIDGALPMVISMREKNIRKCIIPFDNKEECGVVEDMEIIPVKCLNEVIDYLNEELTIASYKNDKFNFVDIENNYQIDFLDIKGQEGLKRAFEVAAAGNHNMLIIGPPGSGKTMAARRLPTILPKLSFEESIEVTKIYSVSGLLNTRGLIEERPFRSPHHTASNISLIGGGRVPKPGEVSLAHNGVLFLDELPEFSKNVLEVLRQPLEDGVVNISRVNGTLTYPAKFMFIASMNPCPCGYYGDPLHECTCSQNSIDRYLGKISYPLLDRIDIHIEVSPVKYKDLHNEYQTDSSNVIRERVQKAREIQLDRYMKEDIYNNSQIPNKYIKKYCKLSQSSENILKSAFTKYKFSARTYNKLLKVARTIADLDSKENIEDKHILEAIRYRTLDNKYWG